MKNYPYLFQSQPKDDQVISYRLEVLSFFKEFGLRATKKAFKVSKTTVYRWKKTLADNQGKLASLLPKSTKPEHLRRMETDLRIVEYIRKLREEHFRLGKQKVKPLLDQYCFELGIKSISVSTIGKLIKRNHFFFQKQGRVYHNPSSGWAQRKPTKRLRIRYSPKPTDFGHLQMDTVFKIVEGMRSYLYSAIDIKLKFGLTLAYSRLNSQNTLDFFQKVELVYPLKIKSVQTDNGLEFLGVFHQYLLKRNIPHFFIYPRCPRINGVIERYQRTLQEEFFDPNSDLIHSPKLFNDKLAEYLLFYNLERPHHSLGLKSPLNYLVSEGYQSQMCVTHTDY
ncbi:transposase [Candidatus Gottesmanbacteria bacterium]|nr:transposase [Candidatus Gottesmanbacteria bacterium]